MVIGESPDVLTNVWSIVADINPYPVRNKDDFFIDQVLSSYLKDQHPFNYFPYLWNSLPIRLKSINNKKKKSPLVKFFTILIFDLELNL